MTENRGRRLERRLRPRKRRRGAATVEFALCVPILFTVILASVEFSRLVQIKHAVRQAAFEGARNAIALDSTQTTAQTQAALVLTNAGIKNSTVTISPFTYTTASASATVSVDPSGNSWFIGYLTSGKPITATITLDREVQAISVPGP